MSFSHVTIYAQKEITLFISIVPVKTRSSCTWRSMRRSPIWMTRKSLWTERISGSSPSPTISGNVRLKFKKKKFRCRKIIIPTLFCVCTYLFWSSQIGCGPLGLLIVFGVAKWLAFFPIPQFDFRRTPWGDCSPNLRLTERGPSYKSHFQ